MSLHGVQGRSPISKLYKLLRMTAIFADHLIPCASLGLFYLSTLAIGFVRKGADQWIRQRIVSSWWVDAKFIVEEIMELFVCLKKWKRYDCGSDLLA